MWAGNYIHEMRLSFKEWLLSTPDGAGEIWDNKSNTDRDFGRTGAKSKNVGDGITPDVGNFDPDKLYLGNQKKKSCKKK